METTTNYSGLLALLFTALLLVGVPMLAVLYSVIWDYIDRLTSVKHHINTLNRDLIWVKKKIKELKAANIIHKNHISEYGHIISIIEKLPVNKIIIILNGKGLIEKVRYYEKELKKISTDLENYNVYHNLKLEVIKMAGKLSTRGFGNSLDELYTLLSAMDGYDIPSYYKYDSVFTKWKNSNTLKLEWVAETEKYAGMLDFYRGHCHNENEKSLIEGILLRIYPHTRDYYDDMDRLSLVDIRKDFYGAVEHFEKEIERELVSEHIIRWISEFPYTLEQIKGKVNEIIKISEKVNYIYMGHEIRNCLGVLNTNFEFILERYNTPKSINMYYSIILDIISTIYEYSENINSKYNEAITIDKEFIKADMIRDNIWVQVMALATDTENDTPYIRNKMKILVNDHTEKRSGLALVYQNQRSIKIINDILYLRNQKKNITLPTKTEEVQHADN